MFCILNGKETTLSDLHEDPLARSILISLFSWRRADNDDKLPGNTRFGWWGDSLSGDDKIGSKLWLLTREKMTDSVLAQAKAFAEESLSWMLEDGVASQVIVFAEKRKECDGINISVTVVKPDRSEIAVRFMDVWRSR